VLDPTEARALLDSIDVAIHAGLRDRALIRLMVYSFARIGVSNSAAAAWRLWPHARRNRSWTTTAVSLAGALSGPSPTVTH
jgi:hypothetical protein